MSEAMQGAYKNNLPESNIKPRPRFSIVWLVPLIAILIGAWIGFKAWAEKGPHIQMTFSTAEGLEPGKTKIKYKDVEIGVVSTIEVSEDGTHVNVAAEMKNYIKPYLTDKSRFWVVKAHIGADGVSGLSTLLSGAYIVVDPSSEGNATTNFVGLDTPPVITGDTLGKHFVLHTDDLASIQKDVPIYYRKFSVGKVEGVKLNDDGTSVTVRVFINAPYDQWVNSSTKFWNASGVDFSMNTDGISVDTESIVSMLIGGIAFESVDLSSDITQAENNASFKLYANRTDTLRKEIASTVRTHANFVINFTESVRGLTIGAPVEFRGIKLGEVKDIQLSYNIKNQKITVPVTISIDYERLSLKNRTTEELYTGHKQRADTLIKHGLRAQLETGSLLTGKLFVGLDFFPDEKPFSIDWQAKIPEFPSVPGTFGALKIHLSSILNKVDNMMTQVEQLSRKLNHNLEPELSGVLKQAENTLVTLQGTLKKADGTLETVTETLQNDSPLQQDLQATLREFNKAARSVKELADYLEKHPESLIEGK